MLDVLMEPFSCKDCTSGLLCCEFLASTADLLCVSGFISARSRGAPKG